MANFEGSGRAFANVSKFCSQQEMKVKKNQIQLYHSVEDKKVSKSHLKTITWEFHVCEIYTFESCMKSEPRFYRLDTESVIY